jgi:hypothetical protein
MYITSIHIITEKVAASPLPTVHKVNVTRTEQGGKKTINAFHLGSEAHCMEFLRQIAPYIAPGDTVITSTVMDIIQITKLKESFS